jgi:hypothetical protein
LLFSAIPMMVVLTRTCVAFTVNRDERPKMNRTKVA